MLLKPFKIASVYSLIFFLNWYEEVPMVSTTEVAIPTHYAIYEKMAKRIGSLEDDPFILSNIMSSLRRPHGTIVARLINTCKFHKGPGRVSHRPAHAVATYSFLGLSCWVASTLIASMQGPRYEYLIRDFQELVICCLDGHPVADSTMMVEIDVADFFMSGEIDELKQSAISHLPDGERRQV